MVVDSTPSFGRSRIVSVAFDANKVDSLSMSQLSLSWPRPRLGIPTGQPQINGSDLLEHMMPQSSNNQDKFYMSTAIPEVNPGVLQLSGCHKSR